VPAQAGLCSGGEMSLPVPEKVSYESPHVNATGRSIRDRPKRRCLSARASESPIDSSSAES
jgi:hypothetical protein